MYHALQYKILLESSVEKYTHTHTHIYIYQFNKFETRRFIWNITYDTKKTGSFNESNTRHWNFHSKRFTYMYTFTLIKNVLRINQVHPYLYVRNPSEKLNDKLFETIKRIKLDGMFSSINETQKRNNSIAEVFLQKCGKYKQQDRELAVMKLYFYAERITTWLKAPLANIQWIFILQYL